MKKFFAVILSLTLILSLAACNSPAPSSAPSDVIPSSGENSESASDSWTPVAPGKLTVGTSADYAPFEWHALIDGEDKIVGFDMALAQAIADDLGLELVIVDMAFENIMTELKLGKVDLAIAGIVPKPERLEEADFSMNYHSGYQTLVIKKEKADQYKTLDDFQGLSVGAQTNTVQEQLVNTVVTGCNPVLLQTIPSLIMELKAGTVEAVCLESTVATGYVTNNDGLAIAMEVPYSEGEGSVNAVAVQKGNTQLLEAVNATIQKLQDNGQMDQFVADAVALAYGESAE